MRAVIDHQVRRQREADGEAENRQNGDFGAVLLEAEDQKADVKFHKGRRPPRFRPERKAIVSLDDAYTHVYRKKISRHPNSIRLGHQL